MAQERYSYPLLASKSWWAVRRRFHERVPSTVTPAYLAATLGMSEASAKGNVLKYLKHIGIVDQDGKPTELAFRWRLDDSYPQVCEEIRRKMYPEELLDAFPRPGENRDGLVRWFMTTTRTGEGTAKTMASFYTILLEGDPTKGEEQPKAPAGQTGMAKKERKSKPVSAERPEVPADEPVRQEQDRRALAMPSVHIDIQIHLSPDTTAEQIDQIFASMAKHLSGPKLAAARDG